MSYKNTLSIITTKEFEFRMELVSLFVRTLIPEGNNRTRKDDEAQEEIYTLEIMGRNVHMLLSY